MPELRVEAYEREALMLLCTDALLPSTLHAAIQAPDRISVKFTGAGYFLGLAHSEVPEGRVVCDSPVVVGTFQEREVGFIAFIDGGVVTLECYSYDDYGVPDTIRNGVVDVSAT